MSDVNVSKNSPNNTYGDKANAAGGSLQVAQQQRDREQVLREVAEAERREAEAAAKEQEAEKERITRNMLTDEQASLLNRILRVAIATGTINPFGQSNDYIVALVRDLLSHKGATFYTTDANITNALGRLFGVDPGNSKKTPANIPFKYTAAGSEPPISFKTVGNPKLDKKKAELEAIRKKARELEEQIKADEA